MAEFIALVGIRANQHTSAVEALRNYDGVVEVRTAYGAVPGPISDGAYLKASVPTEKDVVALWERIANTEGVVNPMVYRLAPE